MTLREARTGNEVASEQVAGNRDANCPSLLLTSEDHPVEPTDPDPADFYRALGRNVDGRRTRSFLRTGAARRWPEG